MESDRRTHDPALLRKYLLGEVTEAERDQVEEDLFNLEDYPLELSLAEDDLIDSYVAGELPAGDRGHFESAFLQSPRRRERVATARALFAAAQKAPTPRLAIVERDRSPRRRGVSTWMWPLAAAAALVLVTGAALPAVYSYLSRQSSETARLSRQVERLQTELNSRPQVADMGALAAEVRKSLAADLQALGRGAPAAVLTFALPLAGTRRNAGQPETRLVIPAGQQTAQLRLLPGADVGGKRYAAYRAVIQTADGGQAWGGDARWSSGGALVLTVPAAALKAGDYRVVVSGVSASGEEETLEEYCVFAVVNR